MTEREWVNSIISDIEKSLRKHNKNIKIRDCFKLAYSSEILLYNGEEPSYSTTQYETDILIYEQINEKQWKPRIVIEVKLGKITTHDAITYSQKAQTHKFVHPYLRYGILLANRKQFPLPGRLFRHGQNFDFMFSSRELAITSKEKSNFIDIINSEIKASQQLEGIIYNTRLKNREKFTSLHKPLKLI